jgi:hypothetical protein
MRTIKNLSVPQNSEAKFPFSTIQNETDILDGTPVVEEIYGDVLTNIYKVLQSTGIVPTGTQDNDITQYQFLEALKKLPNVLNDIEQVLSLTGTVWSVPLNLDFLPNKYVFIARAGDNYTNGITYTFKGTSSTTYTFTGSNFRSGDEVLIVIDSSNVRGYSLTQLAQSATEVFTVMGLPVAYNDSNKIWYQEGGKLLSDVPSVNDLESIIRVDVSNGTVLLNEMIVINGNVVCFCLIPATNNYFFRYFSLSNLTASFPITASVAFGTSADYAPYIYADAGFIYVSNNHNNSVNNYNISKFAYNPSLATLTFVSSVNLDATFVKTTNAVIKSGLLYTIISGVLNSFNLTTGVKTLLGNYSGIAGQLFKFNGQVYYGSGECTKKWF